MKSLLGFKIEKRLQVNPAVRVVSLLIAVLAALLISAALVGSAGANIFEAFSALFLGGFGSQRALIETLVKATPLILTGLAATVAFRAKAWNIGAEGQLYVGALAAFWAATTFSALARPLLIPAIFLTAFIAGALCGLIPGFLKARLKVDEILVTVMMNYIARYAMSFLLAGPWRDPSSYYLQTIEIPAVSFLPILAAGTRLHLGFIVALLTALAVFILLWKTPLGYEIRAIGYNPNAARFKGTDVARTFMIAMAISGGVAALAGACELAGLYHRVRMVDIAVGYGYTGIIVAMLVNLNPIGVILAAILFGGLVNGSMRLQVMTGIPIAVVYAMQAIFLLCALTAEVISRYQIRRVSHE